MTRKPKIILDKPIVMVGLMGAGKTSVGRALARSLGIDFVDSDTAKGLYAECLSISKMLTSLISSIKKSGYSGNKFQPYEP